MLTSKEQNDVLSFTRFHILNYWSLKSYLQSILKHSDSNPFTGYEVILDDEGNGQIIQSEAVLTTLEVDEENPGDPSLIIHVPKVSLYYKII